MRKENSGKIQRRRNGREEGVVAERRDSENVIEKAAHESRRDKEAVRLSTQRRP